MKVLEEIKFLTISICVVLFIFYIFEFEIKSVEFFMSVMLYRIYIDSALILNKIENE